MLVRKGKTLKELNPLGMSCVQLVLTIDIGQCLVMQIEHNRLSLEVMNPILQSSSNGIEFLVISGVVES